MIPVIGDLAKAGKLGKAAKLLTKVLDRAKTSAEFGKRVAPMLRKISGAIDSILKTPYLRNNLPEGSVELLQKAKKGLDEVLAKLSDNAVEATKTKGLMKASETIGQPVEATFQGRKVSIRVDIKIGGKLQIQAGKGANSIIDFRPDLTKPLKAQTDRAFKRLPQSVRDQLLKNAQKGLDRLRETGNL